MGTIDELFDMDPEGPEGKGLSDVDLDRIIAYEREARANAENGVKVKKPKGDGPLIDKDQLLAMLKGKIAESGEPAEPKPVLPKSVRRF